MSSDSHGAPQQSVPLKSALCCLEPMPGSELGQIDAAGHGGDPPPAGRAESAAPGADAASQIMATTGNPLPHLNRAETWARSQVEPSRFVTQPAILPGETAKPHATEPSHWAGGGCPQISRREHIT